MPKKSKLTLTPNEMALVVGILLILDEKEKN
jgi:hypothetical protein